MKNNILIDGAFFFRRSLHSTDYNQYLEHGEKTLDNKKTQGMFIRKACMDLAYQFKKFENIQINRVIIVDEGGRSWRKQENIHYKAQRVTSDDVNWDKYYDLIEIALNQLQDKGITLSVLNQAEGDDLIYYYSKYFTSIGENSIIISSDNDLKQLVTHTKDNNFVIHNNVITNKMACTENFYNYLNNTTTEDNSNMFELNKEKIVEGNFKTNFLNLVEEGKFEFINVIDLILEKIVRGDKSDNIFPFYKGIGEKTFIKILNAINESEDINRIQILNGILKGNEDIIEQFINIITSIKKMPEDRDLSMLIETTKVNAKLVTLHRSCIPSDISSAFDNKLIPNLKEEDVVFDINLVDSVQKILSGTEFISKNYKGETNSGYIDKNINTFKKNNEIDELIITDVHAENPNIFWK